MKRVLLLIAILATAWQAATAQTFEQDGIYYTILRNYSGEYVSAAVDELSADKELISGNLIIPDSVPYEGTNYPVTLIQFGAFSNISHLTSVTLPTTLEEIGPSAFYKCTGLASISFPENLVEIGNHAFSGCINLKSIHIPAKVKYLGLLTDHAYMVTSFDGCTGLESITVDENNKWFSSPDNCNAILTGDGKYFTFGCKNSTIPSSVKYIMARAFAGCDIKEVVIPEAVTDIFENAFEGCKKLETVKFEGDTACIGDYAFKDCTSLKSINLPSKTARLFCAFNNCTSLESIVLPKGLLRFSDSFLMCTNLTSITLNENLIDVSGLSTCFKLKEIKATNLSPSNISYNTFSPEQYSTCHVTVPYASYNLYKEHRYWGQFTNLEHDNNVMGDLNQDMTVDISDVNSMVNMILDISEKDMRADLNHDGTIDVTDLNSSINMILGKIGNQMSLARIFYVVPGSSDSPAYHISVNDKFVQNSDHTDWVKLQGGYSTGNIPVYAGENKIKLWPQSTAGDPVYKSAVNIAPETFNDIFVYDLEKSPVVIERGDLPAAPEGSELSHAGVRFVNFIFEDKETPYSGRIVVRFMDQTSGEYNIVPCGSIGFGEVTPWLSHSDIKTNFGASTSVRRDFELCVVGENGELLPLSHMTFSNRGDKTENKFLDYWNLRNDRCTTIVIVGCLHDKVMPLSTTGGKVYPFEDYPEVVK